MALVVHDAAGQAQPRRIDNPRCSELHSEGDLCLFGSLASGGFQSGTAPHVALTNYASLYVGAHYGEVVSAHADGWVLHAAADRTVPQRAGALRHALIEIEGPRRLGLRTYVGRLVVPFGIREAPIAGFLRLEATDSLWPSSQPGARVDWEAAPWLGFHAGVTTRRTGRQVAVRATIDSSKVQRLRTVASLMTSESGDQRLGVGLAHPGPLGALTWLEWIRQRPFRPSLPNRAGISLGFLGGFDDGTRWGFEYQYLSQSYHVGYLVHDVALSLVSSSIRAAAGYRLDLATDKRGFGAYLGLEVAP